MSEPINVFGPGSIEMEDTVMVSVLMKLVTHAHTKQIIKIFYFYVIVILRTKGGYKNATAEQIDLEV